jgi:hypothetical protein
MEFSDVVREQQKEIREDMKTWPQWMLDACYWATASLPFSRTERERTDSTSRSRDIP